MDKIDDKDVCRICMETGVLISLFDNESTLEMCHKVMKCAEVHLSRDDGLPQRICARCCSDLEVAYAFKERCERSDTLLRERLGLAPRTELVIVDCDQDSDSKPLENRAKSCRRFKRASRPDFSTDSENEALNNLRHRPRRRKRPRNKDTASDSDDITLISYTTNQVKPLQAATPANKHPCPHCDKSFPYPSVLKLHMITHTREKSHKCLMCPETFLYSRSLYAHYKEAHPEESMKPQQDVQTSYPCGMCEKVFSQAKNLKVHEAMHMREKKYHCEGCDLGFTNMSILTAHKKKEHPHLFQSLSCNYCNRNFKKKSSLERHIDNHRTFVVSSSEPKKPVLMKDLFKSIAPVTTTHWSDSFSD